MKPRKVEVGQTWGAPTSYQGNRYHRTLTVVSIDEFEVVRFKEDSITEFSTKVLLTDDEFIFKAG
jgi:hypothetical protein